MAKRDSDALLHEMRIRKIEKDFADATRLGITHRFMHLSALSPQTRISHAERSGELFSIEDVREWWSRDGNSFKCRCTCVLVLVDEQGQLPDPVLVESVIAAREKYLANRI